VTIDFQTYVLLDLLDKNWAKKKKHTSLSYGYSISDMLCIYKHLIFNEIQGKCLWSAVFLFLIDLDSEALRLEIYVDLTL
jgi:hypothetical protein